jgi:hypothetical protein
MSSPIGVQRCHSIDQDEYSVTYFFDLPIGNKSSNLGRMRIKMVSDVDQLPESMEIGDHVLRLLDHRSSPPIIDFSTEIDERIT